MRLFVNGQEREVPEGITVSGLLETMAVKTPQVAVELNAEIVRRARHPQIVLREGDRLEIVTFVGGG